MTEQEREVAERVLDKIRWFVAGLDTDERAMFAALIAPAVARVYESEVEGFAMSHWSPADLPDAMAEVIRSRDVHITGLD